MNPFLDSPEAQAVQLSGAVPCRRDERSVVDSTYRGPMDMIRPLGRFFCMDILAGAIEQKKTYRPYYLPQGRHYEVNPFLG